MEYGNRGKRADELARKKAKLEEMRMAKTRAEEAKKRELLNSPSKGVSSSMLTTDELNGLLAECGVPATPNPRPFQTEEVAVPPCQRAALSLHFTDTQTVSSAPKSNPSYGKTTQTDDEVVMREFSTNTQDFEYDEDDLLPMHAAVVTMHHDEEKQEEDRVQKLPELSEEEKKQILSSTSFANFFDYTSKVIMRALAQDNIFVDYVTEVAAEVPVSATRLVHSRSFVDEKWTAGRAVLGISFSVLHPELVAVAYGELPENEASGDPIGVVAVWNCRFKKTTPDFLFYCNSRLTSVAFSRFHPHLIIGGCYSGQLLLWDFRPDKHNVLKMTPCNKSSISSRAHTHPVYSLAVVGSSNAHNIVSLSTDGRLCTWDVETLSQPVQWKECIGRPAKPVAVLCAAFPPNDVNNLIVAGEDGGVYFMSRHGGGTTGGGEGAEKIFEGHSAPVSAVSFHSSSGPLDFSHVFLTASLDWTIRLWSLKSPALRLSLDAHVDYVYDVAWSPAHPAVFASLDTGGNVFLWNLNEDVEGPVERMRMTNGGGTEESTEISADLVAPPIDLRKLSWSANGEHLLVGGADGEVRVLDVHEQLHTSVSGEEWDKFASTLAEVHQTALEAEELSENGGFGVPLSTSMAGGAGSSMSTTPRTSFALLPGQSPAAALVAACSPPLIY